MTASARLLPAVSLPGLRTEVLGNYLASLGLLRLLSRKWPDVRIAWREGVVQVVGTPSLDQLIEHLVEVASKNEWTSYERSWIPFQKESTRKKTGRPTALWQAEANETILELFAAHAVPQARLEFNPLLGTGGNAGQRDFSKGWKEATKRLQSPPKNVDIRGELKAWLLGKPVTWQLPGLAAASWFSNANKIYNSGQQAFREEGLSPWAMALACEGIPFFAGAASRRLGARARAHAAFPFICEPAAPTAAGEAGRDQGEVWAPVWERPMTLPEVRALFQRGRAEVQGHGANTPAAFAAAILQRGVDAGLAGFLRFTLGKTTSLNTFEPRFEGFIPVGSPKQGDRVFRAQAAAASRMLRFVERLPKDSKRKKRWRFVGLRGPVEFGLVRLAQTPNEPKAVCELLDAIVDTLDKIDRNRSFREKEIAWQPLPLEYLPAAIGTDAHPLELRLALALVSNFPQARPFTLYRFGVVWANDRFYHPQRPPHRWIWESGELTRVLVKLLIRRTLDWEEDAKKGGVLEIPMPLVPTQSADVRQWLQRAVDERLLGRWLSRLALFDWRNLSQELLSNLQSVASRPDERSVTVDGHLLLFALLQPLFEGSARELLPSDPGLRETWPAVATPAVARTLIGLVQASQLDAALSLAASRYAMARKPIAKFAVTWFVEDPDRLIASLLFAVFPRERWLMIQRWLRPQKSERR